MKLRLLGAVVFTTAFSVLLTTSAQVTENHGEIFEEEYANDDFVEIETNETDCQVDRALMTEAILQKLTVWVRPSDGQRIYVSHCRQLHHGCESEISTLVDYIFEVSIREDFDPWLLSAIAWHESRFNPFAESDQGAYGILQMLRRSRWSKGLPFVRQRSYRRECRHKLGSCQKQIVERSVYWLKHSIEHCGSVQEGLRMYNSGRCDGPRRYPRAVFTAQRDIIRRAKEIAENNFAGVSATAGGLTHIDNIEAICFQLDEPPCLNSNLEECWYTDRSSIYSFEDGC